MCQLLIATQRTTKRVPGSEAEAAEAEAEEEEEVGFFLFVIQPRPAPSWGPYIHIHPRTYRMCHIEVS